ncbi:MULTISPECIES: IclR family transcriptional regulator [unclassified Paenibacillus]|uniref:IclR family transcriptional regulator n=1 Tax=unclassified Paenibacillus TaxID=185978 RepID=UPI001AE16DD6|nr:MULTISPECIES: IclR family transcriptional regulator [unclassified Paenibacillus]MBP1155594.1 DNA-binding IclR family transcriptional regulator [Paenibacillus sp. PvP091]MBP1169020.1 DNA-binding IclR family transcriptional regulator [Paenibacillus sp. PvR098]MBP2440048.1 DNA-binding IclR family transcriptional regulator [Paenibacillus sp. PvP052]
MKNMEDSITSVHKAIRILREFSQNEPELGISQLSRRLGMAKSTVSRLVQILCDENMVVQNEETRKYHLSLTAFEIGSVVYHEMELCQIALPLLKKMLPNVQSAIQMVTYDKGGIVYLLKLPDHRDGKILNVMGKRVPSHCTASGKVMLAFQNELEIKHVLSKELKSFTRKTITCPDKLRGELQTIRQKGYAVSHEEFNPGMSSLAIPVFNDYDAIIAAICILRPTGQITNANIPPILREMKMYSRLITEQLGMERTKKIRYSH